jgi:hypothetical protein
MLFLPLLHQFHMSPLTFHLYVGGIKYLVSMAGSSCGLDMKCKTHPRSQLCVFWKSTRNQRMAMLLHKLFEVLITQGPNSRFMLPAKPQSFQYFGSLSCHGRFIRVLVPYLILASLPFYPSMRIAQEKGKL